MHKLLFIFLITNLNLFSQTLRSPSEVLDINRINTLENQYQNKIFPPEDILTKLNQELSRYFEQFQKERLRKDTIISIPYDYYNFPLNQIYLLLYVRNSKDIEKTNRIFSPYLYKIFNLKGKIHEELNQKNLAFYSYFQALNYTIPIIETEIPKEKNLPEKPSILDLETILNQKEFIYAFDYLNYLDSTLGNENFLKEFEDNTLKNHILEFKQNLKEIKENINSLSYFKKSYYQVEAKNSQQKTNIQNEYDTTWQQTYRKIQNLWDKEKIFRDFIQNLKNQYSENLFRMANILKEIELKQKERERILNQSSYYRGTGNQLGINKTLYRNFVGYTQLLELAVRLNPDQLDYLDLLSTQYLLEKNIQAGISIEKKWIIKAPENDTRTPKHYLRLISYYLEQKNISLSKEYLDKLYTILNQNPSLQKNIFGKDSENFVLSEFDHFLFFYADFMLKNSFSNHENIFLDLLNKINLKIQSLEIAKQSTDNTLTFKYKILFNLAKIYKNEKEDNKELEILENIYELFQKLENTLDQEKQIKKQKELEILELKQQLFYEQNEEKTRKLYEIQKIEIPNIEENIKKIQTILNSIPLGSFLERIAYFYYLKKDLPKSIKYYDLIQKNLYSNQNERKRALQNLQIIQDIQKKGRWEKILLPDNFER
ncbi:MAG: hypothetical protein ACK4UJ_05685 [Leptonema sp. (in: bacteria)]